MAVRISRRGINFLLNHQPQNFHFIISTRADPPLPLARLRGRRTLVEIRQEDLRFTAEETSQFLNDKMGLKLTIQDIQALESRTEGWIVGLSLAAQSLQDREDRHEFITAFTGSHHYILEYLIEEVLNHQTEPVRRFLLQTSVLTRLNAPLCDAVMGDGSGGQILRQLQRDNLFIIPLDDEHIWFRFHHLFADLLGNLRRQELPAELMTNLTARPACGTSNMGPWTRQSIMDY